MFSSYHTKHSRGLNYTLLSIFPKRSTTHCTNPIKTLIKVSTRYE